jgi:hypothetical protein
MYHGSIAQPQIKCLLLNFLVLLVIRQIPHEGGKKG